MWARVLAIQLAAAVNLTATGVANNKGFWILNI